MAPGSGNTNFSQNDAMLGSRDNSTRFEAVKKASLELNDSFSWKPSQDASSPVTENTMVALLQYANYDSVPKCNDCFGIIWRNANCNTKVWIYDNLRCLTFTNEIRLGQMWQDIYKIQDIEKIRLDIEKIRLEQIIRRIDKKSLIEIRDMKDQDIDKMLNDTRASFMPASLLTHLNAPACMQTSARPNPYIVQALNR